VFSPISGPQCVPPRDSFSLFLTPLRVKIALLSSGFPCWPIGFFFFFKDQLSPKRSVFKLFTRTFHNLPRILGPVKTPLSALSLKNVSPCGHSLHSDGAEASSPRHGSKGISCRVASVFLAFEVQTFFKLPHCAVPLRQAFLQGDTLGQGILQIFPS